jgi:hypothetical protein
MRAGIAGGGAELGADRNQAVCKVRGLGAFMVIFDAKFVCQRYGNECLARTVPKSGTPAITKLRS